MTDLTKLSDDELIKEILITIELNFYNSKQYHESDLPALINNGYKNQLLEELKARLARLSHIEALFEDDMVALEKRGYIRCSQT